jgi:trehalose 6-phosphate synthase
MSAGLLGRRCIIGVDRLDYSKGLVDRFLAYERFMESHPESLNRVTFLQIAPLSRADLRTYAEIRRSLEQAAGRINGRFADTDWTPDPLPQPQLLARSADGVPAPRDVGVVTPMRDGMNLVAKEFVAAQDPADPACSCSRRSQVRPEEISTPCSSIRATRAPWPTPMHQALTMPLDERAPATNELLQVLRRNDIHAWHGRFVSSCRLAPTPVLLPLPRRQASAR